MSWPKLLLLVALAGVGSAQAQKPSLEGVETAELLTLYLETSDWYERRDCSRELEQRGEGALRLVQQRLGSERDDGKRADLIMLLATFKTDGVVRKLESLAVREENSNCRFRAIRGLVDHGDKGLAALLRLLKRQEDRARNYVVDALCATGHPEVGEHLIRALKTGMKSAYADDLVTSIVDNDPDLAVARFPKLFSSAAIDPLSQMVVALVPLAEYLPGDRGDELNAQLRGTRRALLKAVRMSNNFEGYQAARALGALRDPSAFEPIVEALEHNRRVDYLLALARIDAAAAVPYFLRALEEETTRTRAYNAPVALRGLGWSGDPEQVAKILPFLESEEDDVLAAAADALAALGATETAPAIAKRLLACDSDRDAVPRILLEALQQLSHRDTVYPLARLIRDDERSLQVEAARALAALDLPDATRELVKLASRKGLPLEVRTAIVSGLAARDGEGVLECLLQCAQDPVLHDAVLVACSGSEAAREHVSALIELLGSASVEEEESEAEQDAEREARAATLCDLLGVLGDPRAVPPLLVEIDRCADPVAAVRALGRLRDPRAVEVLLRLALGDPERALFLEASKAVLEMDPEDERVEEVRTRLARSYARVADQRGAPESAPKTTARNSQRLEALNLLRLAAHSEGREAARTALLDEGEIDEVRSAAGWALAAIGPEPEDAETLIPLLQQSRGEMRVGVLQALLACRDPAVDARVLRLGKKTEDRALALGLAIYAVRCGSPKPLRALNAALEDAFPLFGGRDRVLHREGNALGVWLTGGPWPSRNRYDGIVRYYGVNRHERVEQVATLIPPNWWLLKWVEEHPGRLQEDSLFGKATRSARPDELEEFLERYPEGRYAKEVRARLAELGQ